MGTKRSMFQGSDEDVDDSLGILGWVFDPVFQLLRDKAFGIQEVRSFFFSLWCVDNIWCILSYGSLTSRTKSRGLQEWPSNGVIVDCLGAERTPSCMFRCWGSVLVSLVSCSTHGSVFLVRGYLWLLFLSMLLKMTVTPQGDKRTGKNVE